METLTRSSEEVASGNLATAAQSGLAVVEARQAPAPVAADPMVAMIERMASDPSIDLERVRTVLELRQSMKEEAAREAFSRSMSACKAEMPQVTKNAENTDNHAKYATLDRMGEAADTVIAKHGLWTSFHPAPCSRDGFLKVVCVVGHTGGFERTFDAEIPIDATGLKGGLNKTATHAWKSTMTYGRRVLTEMIFDIKSRDDDDGNAAGGKVPSFITDPQVEEIEALIIETDSETTGMLTYVGAKAIETMTPAQYAKAKAALLKKKAKATEKAA